MGLFGLFQSKPRTPHLGFAVEGFYPIAIMRNAGAGAGLDFHQVALGNALELLDKGCTQDQALSARWGGVVAITADMDVVARGLEAYDQTMSETGTDSPGTIHDAAKRWRAASTMFLGMLLAQSPGEYERFLKHIKA